MADLFAALWPSSYKGVPFWTEKDDEDLGRRLVVDTFPYRDDPFIEDLGQRVKGYKFTAYVAGDDYADAAAAFSAALDSAGAGTLVLPIGGPVQAWVKPSKRARDKDRIGYIAYDVEFVRAGVSSPLVSVDYSAQLALDAAANVAAVAPFLTAQVSLVGAPSWVVAGAVAGLQDAVATLDAIRTSTPVDPMQSLTLDGQISALYNAIPAGVSNVTGLDPTLGASIVTLAQSLAAAIPAASAVAAFAAASDSIVQPATATTTANQTTASANAAALARLARLALLSAYLTAVVGATYQSRPQGVAAKRDLVTRFDAELALCFGAPDERLYLAIQALRATGVTYLETLITTLSPVLTVTTRVSMPSLALAWTIYQDPTRARDLVLRNDVPHASFMPLTFEALAPADAAA